MGGTKKGGRVEQNLMDGQRGGASAPPATGLLLFRNVLGENSRLVIGIPVNSGKCQIGRFFLEERNMNVQPTIDLCRAPCISFFNDHCLFCSCGPGYSVQL